MAATTLTNLRSREPTATATATAGVVKPRSLQEINTLTREKQFPAMLESFKREIALALPQHLTPERMARLAMTAFSQNSKLAECEPRSVFSAVILSSQLGLEIGVDGQAYLVPYYDNRARTYKAQFIPGWKGYVELINRANRATVWTGSVFKGDKFEYQLGARPDCIHQPMGECDETEENLTHTYAIGQIHGSPVQVIEVWPKSRVIRHRNKFNKVGDKHYSFSNDANFIAYARKVPLLQVMKYMPKSIELRAAMAVENAGGGFDLKDVLEGEWSNIAADAEAAAQSNDSPSDAEPDNDKNTTTGSASEPSSQTEPTQDGGATASDRPRRTLD